MIFPQFYRKPKWMLWNRKFKVRVNRFDKKKFDLRLRWNPFEERISAPDPRKEIKYYS